MRTCLCGKKPSDKGELVRSESRGLVTELLITLVEDCRYAVFSVWVNTIAGSALVPRALRVLLLKLAGVSIGRAQVRSHVTFTSAKVRVGHQAMINVECVFEGPGGIEVGDHTHIAPGVMLLTTSHEIGCASRRCGHAYTAPIVIGDGCWLGARAMVMPGVTIGSGSIIAAGAVVTKSLPPNGVYGGVPAKLMRNLD